MPQKRQPAVGLGTGAWDAGSEADWSLMDTDAEAESTRLRLRLGWTEDEGDDG